MLNKGAFAIEIVRGDPELTADCRVTLNRGDRIGSLDCIANVEADPVIRIQLPRFQNDAKHHQQFELLLHIRKCPRLKTGNHANNFLTLAIT